MKTALTIAGSDSIGGAGIQADLKTFTALGVYGMSVITAVTAQNTLGVSGIHEIPHDIIKSQLDAVFTDIFPDAVKIGMLSSSDIITETAAALRNYGAKNIVLDTVMVSTSGCVLINDGAVGALTRELFPLALVVTPNIPEAEVLCGFKITDEGDMLRAAKEIYENYGTNVLLKGGHLTGSCADLLYNGTETWYKGEKIDNPNTHGTGCTLSSAVAANLALGNDLHTAVKNAKEYITDAIAAGLNLGKGNGPINHMAKRRNNNA